MKIYLVYDLENLTQHELFEAWSNELEARARCVELNRHDGYTCGVIEFDEDGECGWTWREVDLQGEVAR